MRRQKASVVTDIWDDRWIVSRILPTRFGWPIYLGRPEYWIEIGKRGGLAVVLTEPLGDLIEEHRRNYIPQLLPTIPIGKTAVMRLRRLLGIDGRQELLEWWMERIDDLGSMTRAEFARTHGVSTDTATKWDRRLLGGAAREHPAAWYLEPRALALISSDSEPFAAIADALGCAVSTVHQLRYKLRKHHGIAITDRRPGFAGRTE